MRSINIEGTFEYDGEKYGVSADAGGKGVIWVFAPGSSGDLAWQQVHTFDKRIHENKRLGVAEQWVKENL